MSKAPIGWLMVVAPAAAASMLMAWSASGRAGTVVVAPDAADPVANNARLLLDRGRRVFRYETFGNEAFWGETLKLHQAIAGAKLGGVGPGVSPRSALGVGLKVDVELAPAPLAAALKAGQVDLDDPASTIVLLKANALVGITGRFASNGQLSSVGVQCSFCHSTVDDSFAPGIGRRLDGWANRDLNVGALVSLAPDLSAYTTVLGVDEPAARKVLASSGPGKFDALLDLGGANPARPEPVHTRNTRNMVSAHLPALEFYQLALPIPAARRGRFADLSAVVEHYNGFLKLALTDDEKRDLVEYLKSL